MGIVFKASADIQDLSVWSAYSGAATISNTTARTGTYSYRLGSGGWVQRAVTGRSDYYVKSGFYGTNSDASTRHRFTLREDSTIHLYFKFDLGGGKVTVMRGDNSVLLGSTSGISFSAYTWYNVEIYGNIHDSTGSVTVKINGTQYLALTNQDTRNGGTGSIDNMMWTSDSNYMYVDDVVIRDDTWPGTGGLYLLTADGDGSDTGWTASAGQRWECVDEVPPSATDYVSADTGTPNVKNTFTFSNLGITPSSIASVSVLTKAKLSAAGTGNIRSIVKSGTTYGNGDSTALDVTETWAALHALVDPDTSSAWDLTGVNAISAGVETL